MRAWWFALMLAACWRDAPAPQTPAAPEANEPEGPPPETRLVHADPEPPNDRFDQLVGEFQGLVDRMCQCSDSACVIAVTNDLQKWFAPLDVEIRSFQPTDDQRKTMNDLSNRLSSCMTNAMSAHSGSANPTP